MNQSGGSIISELMNLTAFKVGVFLTWLSRWMNHSISTDELLDLASGYISPQSIMDILSPVRSHVSACNHNEVSYSFHYLRPGKLGSIHAKHHKEISPGDLALIIQGQQSHSFPTVPQSEHVVIASSVTPDTWSLRSFSQPATGQFQELLTVSAAAYELSELERKMSNFFKTEPHIAAKPFAQIQSDIETILAEDITEFPDDIPYAVYSLADRVRHLHAILTILVESIPMPSQNFVTQFTRLHDSFYTALESVLAQASISREVSEP